MIRFYSEINRVTQNKRKEIEFIEEGFAENPVLLNIRLFKFRCNE